MNVSVEFCRLDARDDPYTGYQAVAFAELKPQKMNDGTEKLLPYKPAKLGPKNGRLAMLMEAEYLARLHDLQADIASEYQRLFDESEPPAEDGCYENGLNKEQYEEVKKEIERRFPGPKAAYYT